MLRRRTRRPMVGAVGSAAWLDGGASGGVVAMDRGPVVQTRRRRVTAPRAPSLRLPPSIARPRRLPPAVGSESDWGWVSRGRVAPYRGRG